MKPQFVAVFLMIAALMGLAGCGGGASANSFASAPSGGTGGSGGGSGNAISSAGIYINVVPQAQPVVTYLHQFYNFGTTCAIAANATTINDIQCLLNIRELDLYEQGLTLEFNAAPGMCDYVRDTPFSFYAAAGGFGPKSITVLWDQHTPGNSACAVTNNAGTITAGTMNQTTGVCTFLGGTASASGTVTSSYDYTSALGPNCTEGKYNFTGTTVPVDATVSATVVATSGVDWGGLIGNCMETPAKGSTTSGWALNTKYNLPVSQDHQGALGINQDYKIVAPIKFNNVDNFYAANFYGWTQYAAGNQATATKPNAMSYSTDLLSNAVYSTSPTYTFTCYNTAGEMKHRIRLYINEWDLSPQFLGYGSSSGDTTTYTPIADLTQSCDGTVGDCDDSPGWNRIPTGFPGGDYNLKP